MVSPREKIEQQNKRSKKMKENWANPEFREKMSQIRSDVMKKKWEDPEYRIKQELERENRKVNKEWKDNISKSMKKVAEDPEWREAISKRNSKLFEDPDYYDRHIKMLQDTKEQRSNKMKDNWADPKFAYKVMKARNGRKKALDYIERKFGSLIRAEMEGLNDL